MTMQIVVVAEPNNPTEVEKSKEYLEKAAKLAEEVFGNAHDQGTVEAKNINLTFAPTQYQDSDGQIKDYERSYPLVKKHIYTHVNHEG